MCKKLTHLDTAVPKSYVSVKHPSYILTGVTKVLSKSLWRSENSRLARNRCCVAWFESPSSPLSDDILRVLVMAAVVQKRVAFREGV